MNVKNNLAAATNAVDIALGRMSTGCKLNCAADDAAGLFLSSTMTAQLRGSQQAIKNISDGISLLQTADGALSNMTDILARLRDLAVQGANGVYNDSSLKAMQKEANTLTSGLKQIQNGTIFNGRKIFGKENASWSLTTQNTATATVSTLSGGGACSSPAACLHKVVWFESLKYCNKKAP